VVPVRQVSKDQLERARQIPVLDYVLRYEPDNAKRVGHEYRLRDHDSLSVGTKGWYWHSQGIGGKSALDYLTAVRGYGLVDAVCLLLNEHPHGMESSDYLVNRPAKAIPPPSAKQAPEHLPFAIPLRNRNNSRVIAYLQSRGIDKGLILNCIERGDLYESAYRHDCVFKGKDANGKVKYAAIRSTTSSFKGDVEGSDKKCAFLLPSVEPGSTFVMACESPIDALSHQTLALQGYVQPFNGWRLSLGGTSTLGLEYFLEHKPQIKHCLICTDDDDAGNKAAERIAELPGITTERLLPPIGVDWNDSLLAIQKAERMQYRAHYSARDERG